MNLILSYRRRRGHLEHTSQDASNGMGMSVHLWGRCKQPLPRADADTSLETPGNKSKTTLRHHRVSPRAGTVSALDPQAVPCTSYGWPSPHYRGWRLFAALARPCRKHTHTAHVPRGRERSLRDETTPQ